VLGLASTRRARIRRPTDPVDQALPGYVKACHFRAWSLPIWRKDEAPIDDTGARWKVSPYNCGSWRHAGACANRRAGEDIERIKAAIAARPGGYVYAVLTFDPRRFDGDFATAYREIVQCWDRLRKRLVREWGAIEYVCIVERHASGFPHVNVLIRNATLAAACAGDGWKRVRSRWLEPAAKACGFGFRTWLEPMRHADAMAAYLVKLAGEIGKKSQVPIDAPAHFRRLRATRGFLPPRRTNPDITGRLIRKEVEEIEALGLSPLPAFRGIPREVDRSEAGAEDRWYAELDVSEIEPGVFSYAEPYTREVLWLSYSFASASDSGPPEAPPGGCDDEAPPCSDSDAASALQLGWWSGWPEGSGSDGIFHGEG
jgi:hypothetical protein